jgi:hypothetical protein
MASGKYGPPKPPPGKPPRMSAEQFFRQVQKLVAARHAIRDADSVEHRAVWLDEHAVVCGAARLPDRNNHTEFDDLLIDNELALDAPAHTPAVADGGELTDSAVDVRFSEVDQ